MNRFKDLKVWQASIDLATEIYNATKAYPKEELYSLTNQTRRSAVSVSSNIAEGANRNGEKEFINFLSIASGSGDELQTQLIIANKLKFLDDSCDALISKIDYTQNMNYKLKESLKQKTASKL